MLSIAVAILACSGTADSIDSGFTSEGSEGSHRTSVSVDETGSSAGSASATHGTPDPTNDTTPMVTTAADDSSTSIGPASESGSESPTLDLGGTEDTGDDSDTGGPDGVPIPSPGCGVTQINPGTLIGVPLQVDGQARSFNVVVPTGHDGDTPIPLVLAFHGWGLNPFTMATMSSLSPTAEAHGFVVAYGSGVGNSWNAGTCCGDALDQQVDDITYVRAIIDNIADNLCVDLARVYATGFSNGGMLSHRLACEASDVIAAIAPVAGVIMLEDAECTPPRAMPVLHFHGTGDTSVGYYGNGMVEHVSVAESTASWVERNECEPDPTITFMEADTTCETWSNCGAPGVVVTLCSIDGMGHCWPGDPMCIGGNGDGGPSTTVAANEEIATFFAHYSLP